MFPTVSVTYFKEKWAHTGFQKYLRNTSWILFARISVLAANLFASVFIARHLGPENYGILNFVISFTSIVGITLFSIDLLLVKKLHDDPAQTNAILSSGFLLKQINALVTIVLATTVCYFFAKNTSTTLLVFVFSLFTIIHPFGIIDLYFQAHAKTKYISLANILTGLISAIVKFLIVYNNFPLIFLLLSYTFDYLIIAITYVYIYKRQVFTPFIWTFNSDITKYLIKYSWPFTLSSLATAIYIRVDQLFLKALLGSEAVGIYAVAVRFSEVWFFIAAAICSALLPAILNAQKTNRELFLARIKKLYLLLTTIAITLSLFVFFVAPFLITFLYGPTYSESIHLLRIYVWSIVGTFVGMGLQQFLLAENKFKTILVFNILGMLISLIVIPIGITLFGITGAAYANVCAYTLPALLIFYKKLYA